MSGRDRGLPRLKSVAYGAAEVVTRHRGIVRVINGQAVRLPARWCRYYPAEYEREKHDFLVRACRPGSLAIDLGAHLGLFTVAMARAVGPGGRVIAAEPTPSTRDALRRTIAMNALQEIVDVRADAVTDRRGVAVPFFATSDPLSNANGVVPTGRSSRSFPVSSTTIDELADELVDGHGRTLSCIKLDIEGAELAALRGAEHAVRRFRPALSIEVHPLQLRDGGWSSADLWAWLTDAGYRAQRDGAPVSQQWFVEQESCFEVQATTGRGEATDDRLAARTD